MGKIFLLTYIIVVCISFIVAGLVALRIRLNKDLYNYSKQFKSNKSKVITNIQFVLWCMTPLLNILFSLSGLYMFLSDEDRFVKKMKEELKSPKYTRID